MAVSWADGAKREDNLSNFPLFRFLPVLIPSSLEKLRKLSMFFQKGQLISASNVSNSSVENDQDLIPQLLVLDRSAENSVSPCHFLEGALISDSGSF